MQAPKFLELKAREEVLEVIHGALAPRLPKFFVLLVWLVAPFFFLFPLWRAGTFGVILFFLWLLSGVFLLSRSYLRWSGTLFVITDQRLVDQEQKGFFHRVVTEARFPHIDEVSYHVKGVGPVFFGYGTIHVELHGSAADLAIEHVKHPSRICDLLNDLRVQDKNTSET